MSTDFSTVSCYALSNALIFMGRGDPNESMLRTECYLRLAALDSALVTDKWKDIPVSYLAEWMASGEEDPFNGAYDHPGSVKLTTWGDLSTSDLIRKFSYMPSYDINWIAAQQAVKDRLRYLARQVFLKQEASKSEKTLP